MKTHLRRCLMLCAWAPTAALADKYGIDEAMADSDAGWAGIIATLVLLAYLHYKDK